MAKVSFKRIENSSGINDIPVVDGQVIYTGDGKQYMDYGTDRVNMSSGGSSEGITRTVIWQTSGTPIDGGKLTTINLPKYINHYDAWEVVYKSEQITSKQVDINTGTASTGMLPLVNPQIGSVSTTLHCVFHNDSTVVECTRKLSFTNSLHILQVDAVSSNSAYGSSEDYLQPVQIVGYKFS